MFESLKPGDLTHLRVALEKSNDDDYREGEIWQAILNLGYEAWQDRNEWGYDDMVHWVGLTYGSFAKMCILLGRYNQQVLCNGHAGYWDNGYAGDKEDVELHDQMLSLMRSIGIDKLPIGKKAYEVASRFKMDVTHDDHGNYEECLVDTTVDDDYADVAYKQKWESTFGAIVRQLLKRGK